MAHKILFVHGTGVRKEGYDATLSLIEKQLNKHIPNVTLAPCRWGEAVGAKLSRQGASIPSYGDTRGVAVTEEAQVEALWNLLLQDPSFELGLLNISAAKVEVRPPNAVKPGKELTEKFASLSESKDLKDQLEEVALDRFLAVAVKQLQDSAGFEAAMGSPRAGLPPHREALARALVASVVGASLEAGGPSLDAVARDTLVTSVASLLGHDTRSVFSFVTAPFSGLAKRIATWHVRRKRTSVTDNNYPAAGDILVYQAKGDVIRKFIREEIDKLRADEVFIFAHSLGGIASLEMLVENRPSHVKGLITFGSQAPFLQEIGALRTLGSNDPLPAGFPSWINFYDLNDPLSYIGENMYGKDRMSDYEVNSGESFPASHSAYLHVNTFWIQVAAFIRSHV